MAAINSNVCLFDSPVVDFDRVEGDDTSCRVNAICGLPRLLLRLVRKRRLFIKPICERTVRSTRDLPVSKAVDQKR